MSTSPPAVMQELHDYVNPKNKLHCPMISAEINELIQKNAEVILFVFFN